jgi:hypothetical protein
MRARSASTAVVMLLAMACTSPSSVLLDEQRFWCASHGLEVIAVGDSLGTPPSRFVRHQAEVEALAAVGDVEGAINLVREWAAQEQGAADADPHLGYGSMLAWETDAPEAFATACVRAYLAGSPG